VFLYYLVKYTARYYCTVNNVSSYRTKRRADTALVRRHFEHKTGRQAIDNETNSVCHQTEVEAVWCGEMNYGVAYSRYQTVSQTLCGWPLSCWKWTVLEIKKNFVTDFIRLNLNFIHQKSQIRFLNHSLGLPIRDNWGHACDGPTDGRTDGWTNGQTELRSQDRANLAVKINQETRELYAKIMRHVFMAHSVVCTVVRKMKHRLRKG